LSKKSTAAGRCRDRSDPVGDGGGWRFRKAFQKIDAPSQARTSIKIGKKLSALPMVTGSTAAK
jgi:hypothetical protein